MTDFFKVKFHITSINDDPIQDYLGEIISYIRKWLTDKYRSETVKQLVPDWSLFYTGGSFGVDGSMGGFCAETTGFTTTEGWGEAWACKVTEYPWQNMKYIPRKWTTEIGIIPISPSEVEISYNVQYCDVPYYKGKQQGLPALNMPNVIKSIIKSNNWICTVNGHPLTAEIKDYKPFAGELFGLDKCKHLREEQHVSASFRDSPDIPEKDRKWMSLCKVNRPDKNRDIWMQRLADSVNGTLVAPEIDETKEKTFNNRPLIFCEDGPSTPDTIGFWEWTERQNENGKWLSDAIYIEDQTPTEVIILNSCSNISEIIEALKSGIQIPSYVRGDVLFAAKNAEGYEGVSSNLINFNARLDGNVFITIKNNIYTLPCYQLSEDDIFTWKNRKIYKHISLGEPTKTVQICDFSEAIKQLLLQHMSWPMFKAQGVTKSEWQKFKQFILDIPKNTIIEQLSGMYNLSEQAALQYIDSFLQKVESYVDVSDVDSALIIQMLSSHQGLKNQCDEVAYVKWCEDHKAEIQKAKDEVDAIQAEADAKLVTAKSQLVAIQESVVSAELQHNNILADISEAESKCERLRAEIEKYEALGNETMVAVRQKISDAQKDMAGFIADLSVFLPQAQKCAPAESKTRVALWQYECAPSCVYDDDEIELSETWNDELESLAMNLSQTQAINTDFIGMLSAYLYAAYINKIPLLIAGPAGRDFAEIMSVSLFASGAGHLVLGNEPTNNIAETVAGYDERIISVQNMFGKGWQDELPQSFTRLKQQVVWTHPYVEDLAIEPKGLLNYMIPLMSECFVESIPMGEPLPSRRAEKFMAYSSTKKQPLKIGAFKKLKLSKLLTNQLTNVLSDAKSILDQPAKDKDIEILFGLLPICVITGQIDVLKEVIETESGISAPIKAEVTRYIEEE